MRLPLWLLLTLLPACAAEDSGGIAAGSPRGDTARPESSDRLTLSEVQRCDNPLAGPTWLESGEALGLSIRVDGVTAGGAAMADFDGDGFYDLALVQPAGGPPILWGGPEGFTPSDPVALLKVYSLGLADLDGDAQLELLLSGDQAAVLWIDGRALRREPINAVPAGSFVRELRVIDVDGEGDPDLYAARTQGRDGAGDMQDLLLINDGDGVFSDAGAVLPGPQTAALSFDVVLLDANQDQRPDLYLVHDMGRSYGGNVLLINEDGRLVDRSQGTGLDRAESGMGGAVADIDGDGQQDIILANSSGVELLLRGEAQHWIEATDAWAANPVPDPLEMPWGALPLDYDNDGWVDLMVSQGPFAGHPGSGASEEPQPIHLLRNQGDRFVVDTSRLGAPPLGTWRDVIAEDLNGDGVLDLLVNSAIQRPLLYLSQGCTAAGWLAVHGPEGAEVTLQAGGRTQVALISADSGFGANLQPRAWFGLGAATTVDALSVRLPWPDDEILRAGPFDARRRIQILP